MFTAMLSVENILGADHDVWARQRRGRVPRARRRRRRSRRPGATPRCFRAARSTKPPVPAPRNRRRMPPAPGEPVVGGIDATARADAPDPRALRPHYPCLEGLRTIGVMALFFQHTGFTTGLQARPGLLVDGAPRARPGDVLRALGVPAVPAVRDRQPRRPRGRALEEVPEEPRVPRDPGVLGRAHDPHHLLPRQPERSVLGRHQDRRLAATRLLVYGFAQVYVPKYFFHGITSAYTLDAEVIFYLLVPVYALIDPALVPRLHARPEAPPRAVRARAA